MITAGTSATETSNPGQAPAGDDQRRWEEMLASLAALLPDRSRFVLVDGPAEQAGLFATRLAGELSARARPVHVVVDASAPWDSVIFLRTAPALSPDEPLAEGPLRRSTAATGWAVTAYDDAPHRFFAVAERQ